MTYDNIVLGSFIRRRDRFIAFVSINGEETVCHVKNTGRCRELLVPGARVVLQYCPSPTRKTQYDLIAVWKGDRLINMDANAPNKVFHEWLQAGGLGYVPDMIRPEYTHGDSRFDFFFRHGAKDVLAEVKGVTLEEDGVVRFPDAPTLRGVKHLNGLARAVQEGYEAWAVFIIQMENVSYFAPAWDKHKELGLALRAAQQAGVNILALDCRVDADSLTANKEIMIDLSLPEDR